MTEIRLNLPIHFRTEDVLSFYQRDAEQIAERTTGNTIEKAWFFNGSPALLTITLGKQARLITEAPMSPNELNALGKHLLGLNQPVEEFEQRFLDDSVLGTLITKHRGLRIPQAITPFEALCWAIIGQLVSVKAAISIRRRFVALHASKKTMVKGLVAHPEPKHVLAKGFEQLRTAGLSRAKAQAILNVAAALDTGVLALKQPTAHQEVDALCAELLAIKGIGPWTVNYLLLRAFAWSDGSMHGDIALRNALGKRLNMTERPTAAFAEQWLKAYSPFRTLAAAHLWASLAITA